MSIQVIIRLEIDDLLEFKEKKANVEAAKQNERAVTECIYQYLTELIEDDSLEYEIT
tara:strand:+ start:218 stop:388 length:171 start_codon:yes stop_codon:yes gene_type:complete